MMDIIDNKYEYIKDIEKGSWGEVKMYYDKNRLRFCACKYIENNSIYNHEINILKMVNHKNIINMHDYYKDDNYKVIIMEYIIGNDLFNILIEKSNKLNINERTNIITQLFEGVNYLHKIGIAHMDIKIENILYDSLKKKVKIIDFGLSLIYKEKDKTMLYMRNYDSINWHYPPELYIDKYRYIQPEKIDIWSLGVCIYNIIYESNPFEKANDECKLYLKYKDKGIFVNKLNRYEEDEEENFDNFIKYILEIDLSKRKKIKNIQIEFLLYKLNNYMKLI